MPLDYKGRLTYWWTGPNDASPDIERKFNDDFWAAWKATYPNIQTDAQNIDYNQLLNKLRTSLLGNAAPMVVRLQIVGGVEFASKGYFQELKPEDVGYASADFWQTPPVTKRPRKRSSTLHGPHQIQSRDMAGWVGDRSQRTR